MPDKNKLILPLCGASTHSQGGTAINTQIVPEHKRIAQLEKDVTQSIKDRQFTVNKPNQVWVGDITLGVTICKNLGKVACVEIFDINALKTHIDSALGVTGIAKDCQYTDTNGCGF